MINKNNQNKIYNQDNNQNKRIPFNQNKQIINRIPINVDKKNIMSNQNNNMRRNNQNRNININNSGNNELDRAFFIIKNELKKKDDKIRDLQRKVSELINKLKSLTGNNNNFENYQMETPYKEGPKNLYKEEMNNNNLYNNKIGYNIDYLRQNNFINLNNNNIRSNSQSKPFHPINQGYNSDSENIIKRMPGYDNLSHSNENSVLTYNGVQTSKQEVKKYLKDVKERIEPKKFKEFIRNIKLMTAKNNKSINKQIIIESVRNIFGRENLDLFLKFEKIVGTGNQ